MLIKRLAPLGFGVTRHMVHYFAQGTGASGAITLQQGKGITLAKSATGTYTATIVGGTTGVGAILFASAEIVADAAKQATVKSISPTTGVVTFETAVNSALGTPADLADGDILMVHLVIRNSPADSS